MMNTFCEVNVSVHISLRNAERIALKCTIVMKKKKKISHRHWGPLRGSSSPFLALWAGEG